MKELTFQLNLKEVSVNITDKQGEEKTYTLRELTSQQRAKFLNGLGSRVKYTKSGKTKGLNNHEGLQESLLEKCLYDEDGQLIKKDALKEWPAGMLSELFEAAQELSGMVDNKEDDEDEEEEEKNG